MDTAGSLRLKIGSDTSGIDFGSVTDIHETFSKSVSVVPLTSQNAESAIAIEAGSGLSYTVDFKRVDDSSALSCNGPWYKSLSGTVDRWQMLTDGGTLIYAPSSDNPYVPSFSRDGYISRLTRSYSAGDPTVINGSMEFHVGRVHTRAEPFSEEAIEGGIMELPRYRLDGTLREGFCISISDASGRVFRPLLLSALTSEGVQTFNCVKSYSLHGGVNDPFEYVKLEISVAKADFLTRNSAWKFFKAGGNKLKIDAVGVSSQMTVSKFVIRKDTISLTAYCDAEVLRGTGLASDTVGSPLACIKGILTNPAYGSLFTPGDIITNIKEEEPPEETPAEGEESAREILTFSRGTNAWYVLQVCAAVMSARIFFAQGKAYIIDYTRGPCGENGDPVKWNSIRIDLYPERAQETEWDTKLNRRITGEVKYDADASDTVINVLDIDCAEGPLHFTDGTSIAKLGREMEGDPLRIRELNSEFARRFAEAQFAYRREPQGAVSFTVKERHSFKEGNDILQAWVPVFPVCMAAGMIHSRPDEVLVSDTSILLDNVRAFPKLILSSYERTYPQGTTRYTFGEVREISLAASTSQIKSAQSRSLRT